MPLSGPARRCWKAARHADCCIKFRARIALMRLLVVLVAVMPASAAAAQDAVVGTWRGSAEEFSSPHIQGRAQVTATVMPDGR